MGPKKLSPFFEPPSGNGTITHSCKPNPDPTRTEAHEPNDLLPEIVIHTFPYWSRILIATLNNNLQSTPTGLRLIIRTLLRYIYSASVPPLTLQPPVFRDPVQVFLLVVRSVDHDKINTSNN